MIRLFGSRARFRISRLLEYQPPREKNRANIAGSANKPREVRLLPLDRPRKNGYLPNYGSENRLCLLRRNLKTPSY